MNEQVEAKLRRPPVDLRRIHEASNGDTAFETELFRVYIDDTVQHLADLEKAIQENDLTAREHLAHSIKGASANIGTTRLHHYAQELEKLSAEAPAKEVLSLLELSRAEFDSVRDFLESQL